ncbi:MAG: CRTAC1 family protein [Planctomycetota bacterium]|jgi:hypothetical protein
MSKCRLLLRLPVAPTARLAPVVLAVSLVAACEETPAPEDGSGAGRGRADAPPAAWLTDITTATGLADFRHTAGEPGRFLLPEIMGSGAAMFDADGDGDLDIYLANGHRGLPGDSAGASPVNQFFRQESDGRFRDETATSGLGDSGYGMGVAVGDLDNDGDLDVYVANHGRDQLFQNDGDGRFTRITDAAGADVGAWSSSAAFVDFDRDGWLDLYVTRYVEFDPPQACRDHAGRLDYCGPKSFPAVHDVLLRNLGRSGAPAFEDVSSRAGLLSVPAGAGLGVVCEDLDGDGWIDVFVANDGDPNHLWINSGDGTFSEKALARGVAFNLHGQPEAGMGVVAADFDRDADLDLFLTHQARETNTLYLRSDSGPGYQDATGGSGLGTSSVPYTGFGTAAVDLDHDGNLELLVVGGRVIRAAPRGGAAVGPPWDRYAEPNLLYVGDGQGRFALERDLGGAFCASVEITRGLATGDVDGDGDLDVLVTSIEGPARLYRNDAPRRGHWLLVRTIDPALGRDALGAQVTVDAGGHRFLRTISATSSYQSSSDPRAHFGLGEAADVEAIDVRWPDGTAERFGAMPADRAIVLRRGEGEVIP